MSIPPTVRTSLEIAELLATVTTRLAVFEDNEDVEQLRRYLGMAESVARRWHMREGLDADILELPEFIDLEDTHTNDNTRN